MQTQQYRPVVRGQQDEPQQRTGSANSVEYNNDRRTVQIQHLTNQ